MGHGLLLLVFVSVAYGAFLGAPLMFDDIPNLLDNPLLAFDTGSFDGWRSATFSGEAGTLLRPVSMFSFAINHALADGFDPVQLKAGNLLIHLLCAILIYRLALLLFTALERKQGKLSTKQLALLAAACWILHPLHVSTVLYAVQRMAQLSTLFVLLGLLVYSHYRLRWTRQVPRAGEFAALLIWGALITCLAMLSKENGVLLPWLVLVLEVTVFRGRLNNKVSLPLQRLAVFLMLLPLVAVVVTYLFHPATLSDGYGNRDFNLQERVLTQLRVLWHYVYWFCWPDIRNMGFQHDDILYSTAWLRPVTTLVAGVAWALAIGFAIVLRNRFPTLMLGVCFFLVGHALESSVLPLEMAFEHRNYLPSVGLAFLVAGVTGGLCERLPGLRPRVIATPLLIALSLLLLARCYLWSDMTRFTRADAINHPGSIRAQFLYADALYSQIGRDKKGADVTDGALLFAAREQFIKVNEGADGHSTALAMLYFSNQVYLSQLDDRPDWLSELSEVLLSRTRLTASDHSAIEALTDCAMDGICEPDRMRVLAILEGMLARSPRNRRLLEQRYKLSAASGLEAQRTSSLADLRGQAPGVPALYSYLVTEHAATGNKAGVYLALAGWLSHDHVRKYLPLLRMIAERELESRVVSESNVPTLTAAEVP